MFSLFTFALLAYAKTVFITVGGDEISGNFSSTFSPQLAFADVGDLIFWNFTAGNHSVTQSEFASPCLPAHDTNVTVNGFDTSLRPAGNGTAITNFQITVTDTNPIWYYDESPSACGQGAVGAINANESSTATLAGFIRNAERLNGTASTSTTSGSTGTATSPSSQTTAPGNSSSTSSAVRTYAVRPASQFVSIVGTVILAVVGAVAIF